MHSQRAIIIRRRELCRILGFFLFFSDSPAAPHTSGSCQAQDMRAISCQHSTARSQALSLSPLNVLHIWKIVLENKHTSKASGRSRALFVSASQRPHCTSPTCKTVGQKKSDNQSLRPVAGRGYVSCFFCFFFRLRTDDSRVPPRDGHVIADAHTYHEENLSENSGCTVM